MNLSEFIFFFFIALTIVPALFILFTKNVLYAAFLLLITFLGIAGLYVFAYADFLAIAQIMIYVGGVLVLILFGIMLTNRVAGNKYVVSENRNLIAGALAAIVIFAGLFAGILQANFETLEWISNGSKAVERDTTLTRVGEHLMTNYILPFEVAAILLMVALIGAAYIANQIVKKR